MYHTSANLSSQSILMSFSLMYYGKGITMLKQNRILLLFLLILLTAGFACSELFEAAGPPNVVIVFLDDSGWADFKPFGSPDYPTPNVQRLAEEGRSFHNFYVPQAVCSASRAALMTGCNPGRTGVFGAHRPDARGLDPKFATIAEVLKPLGYTTAFFGKWHLGDQPETRPPARGFDESGGLMYSNDMWEFHPERPDYWGQWPLHYWRNGEVTIERITSKEQKWLTTWSTEFAVEFINKSKDRPFFLYVPHSMPHVPLFCSDKFEGKSGIGLYADVMMEIDWSVGEITKALKDNGLEKNTMVIFTSDNGPWISYGNHAGKTPFREAKATSFDGGTRSACIIKYPQQIEANTVSEKTFFSIDILPTICHLTGAPLPANEIDGNNVWDIIIDKPGAENPNEYYAFSTSSRFEGVMSGDGRWKLHIPHEYRTLVKAGMDGAAGKYRQEKIELSLFDMQNDPYEKENVIGKYPDIADRLTEIAERHKDTFFKDKEE
jgi:arylsulfatase A-like enzyme